MTIIQGVNLDVSASQKKGGTVGEIFHHPINSRKNTTPLKVAGLIRKVET